MNFLRLKKDQNALNSFHNVLQHMPTYKLLELIIEAEFYQVTALVQLVVNVIGSKKSEQQVQQVGTMVNNGSVAKKGLMIITVNILYGGLLEFNIPANVALFLELQQYKKY